MSDYKFIPVTGGLLIKRARLICKDANALIGGHEHVKKCWTWDEMLIGEIAVGELKKLLKKADCSYRYPMYRGMSSFLRWNGLDK
jgi:hypothetical protein